MKTAVIVSYYNNPTYLRFCLDSLEDQTEPADEVIICDDGSDVIMSHPVMTSYKYHPRQPQGFAKGALLNRAIAETDADYLIFADQDCVYHWDWVKFHKTFAREGRYITGAPVGLLPVELALVTRESIKNRSLWDMIGWSDTKLDSKLFMCCGSSCWRSDALAINGFDERFGWCGLDINFGSRLDKLEIQFAHANEYDVRYFHLPHDRPWAIHGTEKARWLDHAYSWIDPVATEYGIKKQEGLCQMM